MINRVVLIGRLTKDPDLRQTSSGIPVSSFSLAVDRRGSDDTDFINITAWEKIAENVYRYLHKGSLAAIEGRITTDKYESNGSTVYRTYVTAEQVTFLDRRS